MPRPIEVGEVHRATTPTITNSPAGQGDPVLEGEPPLSRTTTTSGLPAAAAGEDAHIMAPPLTTNAHDTSPTLRFERASPLHPNPVYVISRQQTFRLGERRGDCFLVIYGDLISVKSLGMTLHDFTSCIGVLPGEDINYDYVAAPLILELATVGTVSYNAYVVTEQELRYLWKIPGISRTEKIASTMVSMFEYTRTRLPRTFEVSRIVVRPPAAPIVGL